MALFFFQGMCLLVMVFGFGMWGIRKLLGQNSDVGNAIKAGIIRRITRFFM